MTSLSGDFSLSEISTLPNTESSNEGSIARARELINDNYEIDLSSVTKEELGELLIGHSAEVNALRFHTSMTEMSMQAVMSEYGKFDSKGEWYAHKPLTVIQHLLPQLTEEERQTLINTLLPHIDV